MSALSFTARVDVASGTKWVDNRLVPLHKPAKVRVAFWQPHEDDGPQPEVVEYRMTRADAAATIRQARRDGRLVEQSVCGWCIER